MLVYVKKEHSFCKLNKVFIVQKSDQTTNKDRNNDEQIFFFAMKTKLL